MSRNKRLSILLALCSFACTCSMIELIMRFTVDMSAGRQSVIFEGWERAHWTPINSLGYRDVEPYSADLTNVLVVGDSYIAGYGVNRIEDRVSGVLQTELGSAYGVNIAAEIAWETPREFEALQAYPVTPDVVIWSYYTNDIFWTHPNYPDIYPHQTFLEFAADRFYISSFLYRRLTRPNRDTIVESMYQDADALARHLALLQEVIDYCEARGIPLIFIVWAFPSQDDTVGHITTFLDGAGATYLDAAALLRGRPLQEITASPLDAHPPAAVHAEVARLLLPMITATVDARR